LAHTVTSHKEGNVAKLIGAVSVTPKEVQPGQSVYLQVIDPSGNPYGPTSDVFIAIDGVPVSSLYMQFPSEGTRTIPILATQGETSEVTTATVTVTGKPMLFRRAILDPSSAQSEGSIPFMSLSQHQGRPYQVTFSLVSPPSARAAAARQIEGVAPRNNIGRPLPREAATPSLPARLVALQSLQKTPLLQLKTNAIEPFKVGDVTVKQSTQYAVLPRPVLPAESATAYVWTFGDGKTETTTSPSVTHDYFGSIKPGQVPFAFDVSCHIDHDNITVTRTLVLYSAYGISQRDNITVPHAESDTFATPNSDKTSFATSLIVYNIENNPSQKYLKFQHQPMCVN
jgi:hypothetical protein